MERSGHTFLKRRMAEQDCLLGCEASGHYFFRELRGGDDGLLAALLMTEVIGRRGWLGALAAALPPMFVSCELRLPEACFAYDEVVRLDQASYDRLLGQCVRALPEVAEELKDDPHHLEVS